MERKVIQLVLVLSAIFLWDCSDESKPFKIGKQPKFDIQGAEGIIVYNDESNSGGRIAEHRTNLYKITDDGNIEGVNFLYNDGQGIDSDDEKSVEIVVRALYNVNDNFLVLNGDFYAWDTLGNAAQYRSLLLRKTDGAIFELANISDGENYGVTWTGDYESLSEAVQSDQAGNIYYNSNDRQVIKVDTTDPLRPSKSQYLPTGQTTDYFGIDTNGNCIYHSTGSIKVRKNLGGLFEIIQSDNSKLEFWIGSNGDIYLTDSNTINRLAVNANNEVSLTEIWEYQSGQATVPYPFDVRSYIKVHRSNSVIFVNLNGGSSNWEFFEDNNSIVNFTLPTFLQNAKVAYSDEFYYVSSGTNLYKISLENHSYQNILTQGEYEIYTMSVNNDEELQISALRFSDGKKIIAEINAQNQFTVIDEEQDKEVIYLQRLN